MEWEFLGDGEFIDYKVIGVTDILILDSNFPETVNIVVENNLADKYIGLIEGIGGNLGLIFEKDDNGYYCKTKNGRFVYTNADILHDLKLGCIKPYTEEVDENI